MASLFRPTYTDKKTGELRTTRKWYGRGIPGRTRAVPLSANKAAAQIMLSELVRKGELAKVGVEDVFEASRKLPILCPACQSKGRRDDGSACACPGGAHLTDYRRALEAREKDPRYVVQAVAHVAAIAAGTGAKILGQFDAGKVEQWLAERRRLDGRGPSTSNHYLGSAKGFTRWLTRTNPPRWAADPLACLAKLNAATDVRRRRRALSAGEAVRLLAAAAASAEVFRGQRGRDRFFLYTLAFQSGLRASELASLRPASFRLDADPPFVRVEARRSKRRRLDEQPLPRELADSLRPWLAGRPADVPVWPGTWRKVASVMAQADLAAARAAWLAEADDAGERSRREASDYLAVMDGDGREFDFHATRHSYVTLLAQSGVHPKAAQDLARHSDVRLTMNAYTHLRLADHAAALESFPSLLPAPPATAPGETRATGTDGAACRFLVAPADADRRRLTTPDDGRAASAAERRGCNPLPLLAIGGDRGSKTTADDCGTVGAENGGDQNDDLVPNPAKRVGKAYSGGPLVPPLVPISEKAPADPDLARVVETWPDLPDPIRRAMLALLDAAGE